MITVTTPTGAQHCFYPHYWSTHCIHGKHGDCRLTCKHCERSCLCPCHEQEAARGD